jgi:excisionase family DNA binding protein
MQDTSRLVTALADVSLDAADIAQMLKSSVRTIRRLDAEHHIPGRFTIGRSVRFHGDLVREWIRDGCPHSTAQTSST